MDDTTRLALACDVVTIGRMKHLTDAVEAAVQASNWYAALTVALTLPDIAGWVDDPKIKSQARYAGWIETHLSPMYTRRLALLRRIPVEGT